jgi:RNA polymerase sigma-70 factor (ECF subfamily)
MAAQDQRGNVFEEQRSHLFAIAYRLLGSVTDAEDVVQDTFLRWDQDAQRDQVRSPRAYLATIAVRLCMDQLRSARAKREVYVGPWLPEPLITTGRTDLTDSLVMRESLSFAFLLMLENLSPLERAVFVLREVFDYDYPEIARIVDKSEANCRQLFHRARQRLAQRQSRFEASHEQTQQVTELFMHATTSGDVDGLLRLLAEDAVSIGDAGGRVPLAGLRPIVSRQNIARGLLGNLRKMPPDRVWLEEVNGQPAIVASRGGQPYGVVLLEVHAGQVQRLYSVVNPEKLRGLPTHPAGEP